MIPSMA